MTPFVEWQLQAGLRATLLLGGLFVIWRLLPTAQPALRRWILLAACAGLIATPWTAGWWHWNGGGGGAGSVAFQGKSLSAATGGGGFFPWTAALAGLWIAGSFLVCLRIGLESWALHRLIRRARPWTGPWKADGPLAILQSSAISGPCVAGGRRPVLLLPDSAHAWTPAQWRMVLTHERQHLHQRDLLLAWLPRLVLCLYWWHPLTHWLRRQFHAESEALCDGAVIARSGQGAREYIEFLMALNTGRLPLPAHSAGMAMKSRLGQRIERLLLTPPRPVRWWTAAAAVSIITTLALTSLSLRTVSIPAPVGGDGAAADRGKAGALPRSESSSQSPWPSQSQAQSPSRDSASNPTVAGEPPDEEETAQRLAANPFPRD
ncbi:MAG: blaR1 2 [Verrucomicrobiales bacterium]|nr:blaR1 2 [Verrucomicrobiales bacterium]